jgi:glyoxylase-like metal-dependent hydrolase (beta-lactamase superfamily II)
VPGSPRENQSDAAKEKQMEVAEGIHRIDTELGDRVNAAYLLVGTNASMLVDTTIAATAGRIADYMGRIGVDPQTLRYVINTHSDWDHFAGNAAVKGFSPNAVFCCHEADRAMIENVELLITHRYGEFFTDHGHDETEESMQAVRDGSGVVTIDVALRGGEVIALSDDWRVVLLHTPGHSWGSISVHDPRSDSVIVGDGVLGDAVVTRTGEPAFPPTYRYVDTYLTTLQFLQQLKPHLLLTSHYPIFEDFEAMDFLALTGVFVERVENSLRNALQTASGPTSMRELTEQLSPELGRWPQAAASALFFPLSGHMERLSQYGLVETSRQETTGHAGFTWRK